MESLIVWTRAEEARTRVCGLGLLERLLLAARQAGVEHVLLCAPAEEHARITRTLELSGRVDAPPLRTLEEVLEGFDELVPAEAQQLLLSRTDRVVSRQLFSDVAAPLGDPLRLALGALRSMLPDQEEHSAGLLRASRTDAPGALRALVRGVGALHSFAESLPAAAVRVAAHPHGFALVRAERDVAQGESVLLRSLIKPTDGVISRNINRHISLAISRWLAPLPVRPNHVTAVVLLLGLASGPAAARGDAWGFAIGGLLYYLAAILDGCDGELSRLKYLGSPLGTWFDTVTDDLSALSFLGGMYLGLYRSAGSSVWLWLGAVAVVANVVAVALRYRLLVRLGTGDHQKLGPPPAGPPETPLARAVEWLRSTIFRTDFIPFAAFVLGVLGLLAVFAAPYPAGALAAVVDGVKLTLYHAKHPLGGSPSPKG